MVPMARFGLGGSVDRYVSRYEDGVAGGDGAGLGKTFCSVGGLACSLFIMFWGGGVDWVDGWCGLSPEDDEKKYKKK